MYIGGVTATFADFGTVVDAKLPWFILTIVGLSFLLLVVAFRSLLIPGTAAVMNLLAAAATFGVLTAFFQWGWGTGAFGLGQAGPVEAFLPVVTLAILFGLSISATPTGGWPAGLTAASRTWPSSPLNPRAHQPSR